MAMLDAVNILQPGPSKSARWLSKNLKYTFIAPAVIFVVVMMAFPLGYTAYLSFQDWNGSAKQPPQARGFDNYSELLNKDLRFGPAVVRTFQFSALAVTTELLFGLGIALLVHGKFPGQSLIKTLILLPMVATPVAIAMAWLLMFEPTIGFLNVLLHALHIPPQPWLGSEHQAMLSLVLVDVWQWTPLMALIFIAGLTALPNEPYEAARVDGAGAWARFAYLTLPMLFPTIISAVLLRSIDALKTFDIIYTMTAGGPGTATETLNIYSYVQAFQFFSLGKASSLLVIFFAIVLGVSLLFVQIRQRWGQSHL